jgi:hybrid cluster-associated redox disulfide protein
MITKDMGIIEIAENYPEVLPVFQQFGMGCIGCMAAHFETLEQGVAAHGIDIDEILKALNAAINK